MEPRKLRAVRSMKGFQILEETLSADTKVYSVWIKSEGAGAEIHCIDLKAALALYILLSDKDKYYL